MTEAEFIAMRLVFLSWLAETARLSGKPKEFLEGVILSCPELARRVLPGDDNVVLRGDVMHRLEELHAAALDVLDGTPPCTR